MNSCHSHQNRMKVARAAFRRNSPGAFDNGIGLTMVFFCHFLGALVLCALLPNLENTGPNI